MKTTKWMTLAIGILAGACGSTDDVEVGVDGAEPAVAQQAQYNRADTNGDGAADDTSDEADDAATTSDDASASDDASTSDSTDTDDTRPAECGADECGPGLGAPNFFCDDGSMGGPVCERDDTGTCGWIMRQCPASDECKPEDCGAPTRPPIVDCSDGSVGGPVCERDRAGVCSWGIRECPAECEPDSCGDQPDWLQICSDGSELLPVCSEAPASLSEDSITCNWILPTCP